MINVVPMTEKDITSVVAIENMSFAAPKSEAVFREDEHKYLVVKDSGKVVGYIGIEKIAGEIHIINMAVDPACRGKGIGKQLLEAVLNNSDVFYLEVRTSNRAAIKLYQQYGFEITGIRKKYYQDNSEDALTMRRGINGKHT
ncbi:MAG: ribosomal protein S18-alanine N-acetyltransferase [Candidatus Margulisbacteria bacterium]|nr:ribosomal protein S18-alanine N-acetyltransferase [Candidatus Margulisiibacteriota bacterium]